MSDKLAIIATGGKQYKVNAGSKVKVEKLDAEVGAEVVFDQVLLDARNGAVKIGMPTVNGSTVKAKVLEQGKGEKVITFKYKPKKRTHRKYGHRQPYTLVEIL